MTPIVFIPGMMCDARLFAPQIAAINDRAVMVAPIINHDRVEALATEILSNAPLKFALAGLSMGGIVAMEVMRQAADRVERVALMDTNPRAELPAVANRRTPQMEAVREGRLGDVMRDEMMPHYLVDGPHKPELLALCMDMAVANGADVFIRQSLALRERPDQQDTLRAYSGKALVLCGRHDALCPLERHELMNELLMDSELVVIENAGHMPTLEQPEITNAALHRWLEA